MKHVAEKIEIEETTE